MRVGIDDLKVLLDVLQKNNLESNSAYKCLKNILDDSIKDKRAEINLIDRDYYIASALWLEDDIKNSLKENNYQANRASIELVLQELDTDYLEEAMVERGWSVINNVICDLEDDGLLKESKFGDYAEKKTRRRKGK